MINRSNQPTEMTAYQTVLQAELEHLRPRKQRSQLKRGFIWLLVLIALIAFVWRVIDTIPQLPSLLLWLLNQFNLTIPEYYTSGGVYDTLMPFTLLFPICVVIWEIWLMLQTLTMSANSIARERSAKWELLLLTNLSARQVIRAKWRAIIQRQWKDYALLAIMRIGSISFLVMNFNVNLSFGRPFYFSYGSLGPETEPERTVVFLVAISIVLLSAIFIALLTMVNLILTAACGILGGSLARRKSLAVPLGIGIRLFVMTIFVILAGMPGYLFLKPDIENIGYYSDPVLNTVFLTLGLIGVTMIDNGSITAGLLIRFGYYFRWTTTLTGAEHFLYSLRGNGPAFFTALLISSMICVVVTYVLLRRAEKNIVRQSLE